MPRNRIFINVSPIANHYAYGTDERIIEFESPNGGGLIAFQMHDDGTLAVVPYRLDDTVNVAVPRHARIRCSLCGKQFTSALDFRSGYCDESDKPEMHHEPATSAALT